MRAEVFHTLEGPKEGTRPVALSNECLLINELVREYLTYSGYHNALGVFMAESGQPQDKALDRAFIRDEVTIENEGVPAFERERGFALISFVDVALAISLLSLELCSVLLSHLRMYGYFSRIYFDKNISQVLSY